MKNRANIQRMITCIDKIQTYCEDVDYSEFESNSQLAEACVFNLGQIGEYVNRLDDAFIEAHAQIPWYQIRGLRNRIVHDYEGVNLILVWDIISDDIPKLRMALEKI